MRFTILMVRASPVPSCTVNLNQEQRAGVCLNFRAFAPANHRSDGFKTLTFLIRVAGNPFAHTFPAIFADGYTLPVFFALLIL
jgi:hypothetical protein